MNREIPTRWLAVLAFALALLAVGWCWRWAARYDAAVRSHERVVAELRLEMSELESLMLNVRGLLLINPKTFGRGHRDDYPTTTTAARGDERARAIAAFDEFQTRSNERWRGLAK